MRHTTIPAGRFPMPVDLSWDERLDGDLITETVATVLAGLHETDMAAIATCIAEHGIRFVSVEVSDLWCDADMVDGRFERSPPFLRLRFPTVFASRSALRRLFLMAHEMGHLVQFAEGIMPSDRLDPSDPATPLTNDRRNRLWMQAGRVWGNSVDAEWDANRRALSWGFPRPGGARDRESRITGDIVLTVYRSEELRGATADEVIATFNRDATFPGLEFHLAVEEPGLEEMG